MKNRVVVAMSGGVDSSVAAALLKEKGYEVIGMTMCFNLPDSAGKRPICCGLQGIEDARRVAHKLGIKHYVLNMQKDLEEWVIKDFCHEYLSGRTPNPCVKCNQYLKFGILLKKAFALGVKFLATGHYARIEKLPSRQVILLVRQAGESPAYLLNKARDKVKDQSYFLYRLNQGQLRHVLFPLGNYTKHEVRELAQKFDLPVADKLASQEICFLPNTDYRGFLKARFKGSIRPGSIVDKKGDILGRHKGIAFYTIGQREGLGIAKGYPLYIIKIDSRNNKITVGSKTDVYRSEFMVKDQHFILGPIKKKIAVKVRIRYNHQEAPAEIVPFDDKIKVKFKNPQFAVTPGQSAVFYKGKKVLGGGTIYKISD